MQLISFNIHSFSMFMLLCCFKCVINNKLMMMMMIGLMPASLQENSTFQESRD